MDYKATIIEYKRILRQRLVYKELLLNKYVLNGYVSRKMIKGKPYDYYQYRTENGELISIRLTDSKRKLYELTRTRAALIQKNIDKIQEVLKYFSGVPDDDIKTSGSLPLTMRHFRLLDRAVGITPKCHIMFQIIAKPVLGEYAIVYSKCGKSHSKDMIFVNELAINKIPEYIQTAGFIVDRTEEFSKDDYNQKSILSGTCRSGIKYTAVITENKYSANFKLFKKPYTVTGNVPLRRDSRYTVSLCQLFIEEEIEDLFWDRRLEQLAKEVAHEPE